MKNRRQFLTTAGITVSGLSLASKRGVAWVVDMAQNLPASPEIAARDEVFWAAFRQAFTPDPGHKWFNCLAYNPTASSVHEEFIRKEKTWNAWPLATANKVFSSEKQEMLRSRLATLANASADEIALTRNTTESICNVIFGLDLAKGDEVVLTNQDYRTFQNAWTQRERRDGIVVRRIAPPIPAKTLENLTEAFRAAITPRTRVVMFSHLSDPIGQSFPARAIADIAHRAGAQVIVDGALTFGCMPVDVKSMDCDYYGTSLHKGIFAPTGTGFLYVRRDRIRSLWPLYGSPTAEADDIRKFEHRGTSPLTAFATVNDALDVHGAIGAERIAARYRYLKRLWADRIAAHPRCHFRARLEPEHSCGITNLAIDGVDTLKLYRYLYDKRGISAWPIRDQAFAGLWLCPYPFSTPAELDALASAVLEVADKGLPA
jgi:selenocysteine lyase/cysteine desulfurase